MILPRIAAFPLQSNAVRAGRQHQSLLEDAGPCSAWNGCALHCRVLHLPAWPVRPLGYGLSVRTALGETAGPGCERPELVAWLCRNITSYIGIGASLRPTDSARVSKDSQQESYYIVQARPAAEGAQAHAHIDHANVLAHNHHCCTAADFEHARRARMYMHPRCPYVISLAACAVCARGALRLAVHGHRPHDPAALTGPEPVRRSTWTAAR